MSVSHSASISTIELATIATTISSSSRVISFALYRTAKREIEDGVAEQASESDNLYYKFLKHNFTD